MFGFMAVGKHIFLLSYARVEPNESDSGVQNVGKKVKDKPSPGKEGDKKEKKITGFRSYRGFV